MLHCSCPVIRRCCRGLTLVETMVCLLIVGLLVTLAAPAFRDALQRQRIAKVRDELIAALHWARWEAVRRNAPVALQRRSDCTARLASQGSWDCGWDVVTTADGGPGILQTFALPPGVRLAHTGGGETLAFGPSGMPARVAHRFIIGHSTEVAASTTVLCINRTGRVRTVTGRLTC